MKNVILSFVICWCFACGGKPNAVTPPPDPPKPPVKTEYNNPVFKPILADPTVIKDPNSEYFYAFGTEDYWYTDGKNHVVPIVKSKDLVNWTYVKDAFGRRPVWKTEGGIWAPDIAYVNGKYHLYYAYSTWGDRDPGIGLAIADHPEKTFYDQGKLFLSSDVNIRNSIDPFYMEADGKKYLFWGSYNNSAAQTQWGTWAIELSDDGKSIKDMNTMVKIAASDFEGVMIHKHGSHYYFFGSRGGCCDGAASTYRMLVGRSASITGPYLDKAGVDIAKNNGAGTLVLNKNNLYVGPGHCSRIITDKEGTDWILYHAMNINNAIINGVNQRALMLDKVNWDADGWPLVNDGTPSVTKMDNPAF